MGFVTNFVEPKSLVYWTIIVSFMPFHCDKLVSGLYLGRYLMHGDTKCPGFDLKTCICEGVQFEKKLKIIKLGQM